MKLFKLTTLLLASALFLGCAEADSAKDSVDDAVKDSTTAVKDATDDTVDAVKDAADDTVDAVKDAADDTVDAVTGDGE